MNSDSHATVRGLARPEVDIERFARLLLEIAKQEAKEQADADDADSASETPPRAA